LPELRTARLLLREFEETDIPVLHAYNLHPMAQCYEAGPPVSESQFSQLMCGLMAEQAQIPRYSYYFAIIQDTQVVGSCYLVIQEMHNRQAEIGYMIGYEHWGNGYATEAACAMVNFGFETLHLHRIYAEALSENVASRRVLEKVGMRHEGTLRETEFFNERWWHTCIYATLDAEWQKRTDP
jgi:RimJ/RimL family protein N-acetyltransferase